MKRAIVVVVALALSACSDEPPRNSTDIATADLRMLFTLRGTSEKTVVAGSLTGPGPSPRLVEGDRLEFRTPLGTSPVGLVNGSFGFDLPPTGGDFELALLRAPDRGGDLSLKVFLAPPFAIRVPVTASRAAPLTLAWDAAPGPHTTRLSLGGKCVATIQRTLGDVGTYTFNAFELSSSAADPGTCTVTIEMVKVWSTYSTYDLSIQSTRVTMEMTP